MMWQLGQIAETMSRSSDSSPAHPELFGGNGVGAPFWFSICRQPLATVHAGRPNWLRYTARSLAAVGSLYASTIATVSPLPPDDDSLYALSRSAGPYPDGVAFGTMAFALTAFTSVRMMAKQCAVCAVLGVAHACRVVMCAADGTWGVDALVADDAADVAAMACAGADIDRATATNVAAAANMVSTWGRARMSPPCGGLVTWILEHDVVRVIRRGMHIVDCVPRQNNPAAELCLSISCSWHCQRSM